MFLRELSRRRILQTLGLYAASAWLTIEVASEVFDAFGVDKSALRTVMLVALAGFPVVMLIAWRYNLTRRGFERTDGGGAGFAAFAGLVAMVTIAVGFVVVRLSPVVTLAAGPPPTSVAVLAFRNMTGDPANDYLGDGVSEEILNSLAQLPTLHVAARTSSFSFRDKNVDIPTVARSLNVRHVLEGSVRRDADTLRVTAQLIDSTSGFHIWSDNFDSAGTNLLSIQTEIARRIATRLQASLAPDERVDTPGAVATDVGAYDLYLLGRHHLSRRTPESLAAARGFFERAVAVDPDFAAAHAGLSDAWVMSIDYAGVDVPDAVSHAEPSVRRALALDPDLPESVASLCLLKFNQGDLDSAARACRRAVELRPNSAQYLMWLANALSDGGDPAAAWPLYRRALELDPLNTVVMLNLAETETQLLRFDEANRLLDRVRELDPGHVALPRFRAVTAYATGDVARLRDVVATMPAPAGSTLAAEQRLWQGMTEMLAGDWQAVVDVLTPLCDGDNAAPIEFSFRSHCVSSLVLAHRRLGDVEKANEMFETHRRALDQRLELGSPELAYNRVALYGAAGDVEGAVRVIEAGDQDGAFDYAFALQDARMAEIIRHPHVAALMAGAKGKIDRMRGRLGFEPAPEITTASTSGVD